MEQRQYENENYRYEQQPPLTPQYYPVYPVYPAYYYPSPQNHYHSPMPPEHQYRLGAESLAAQLIESENEVHDLRRQLECLKQEKKESQQRLSLLERELHQKKIAEQVPTSQKTQILISSKTSIDITQRPNFIRSILELPSKGLETAFALEPLKGRIVSEDSGEYFRQFVPYVLEEVRANICAQRNIIAKKNRLPFPIYSQVAASKTEDFDDIDIDEQEVDETGEIQIAFWTYERDLPKLDHGFFNEAVLIVLPELESQSFGRKSTFSKPKLEGILAIATRAPSYDDEENNQRRKVKLKITLPKQDYQRDVINVLAEFKGQLRLHWLCGLTPAERMYEICVSMPSVDFQQQFIQADLLQWPSFPLEKQTQPLSLELAGLNDVQRNVIEQLQNVESGLWLLVGPPGTGKTTTAIKFLVDYARKNPNHRILISAPSNQAVRVLLKEALRFLPSNSLALTGIAKNIPDHLQEVYVHKYASYLFKPLIEYKRQLKIEKNIENQKQLLNSINQCLNLLQEKIRTLFDTPTQMHVKENVRRGMNNFLSMLFEETEAFSQLYQNFSSIGSNASSWRDSKKTENSSNNFVDELEKIINLIQKNAFYLESFMLQRSQIVFATLISSGRKWLRKQIDSFSMVLLDEAAQALVPETLIPLYFNPSLYIQIGDPNQLPATITSQAARNKGYEHSMMHWLIREFSQPHEMLTIQYRMDQEICHWISRQYYENRLITAPEVIQRKSVLQENRFLPALFKNSSLFFNVNGEENRRGGSDLTASCFNLIEARKVIDMAYYLIMSCGIQPTQIGIITFYAEQVNILIENLQKVMRDKNKFHDLEIKTVDGFQGGEKDIILVSAVRTSESVGFLNDWRRLNVGMSRAKYGRWIFGKFDSLIRSNSDFSSLLSEHVERVTVVSQEQLSAHVPNNDYTQRRGHVKFP